MATPVDINTTGRNRRAKFRIVRHSGKKKGALCPFFCPQSISQEVELQDRERDSQKDAFSLPLTPHSLRSLLGFFERPPYQRKVRKKRVYPLNRNGSL